MEIRFRDKNLLPLWEKLGQGERLTIDDGLVLYRSFDLVSLGKMAQAVQFAKSGDAVYFAVNQKIEPTNICRLQCLVCGFSAKEGSEKAYELSLEEALEKISPHLQEVHITGALHPSRPWSYYLDLVAAVRKACPQTGIKAYTAVEIDYFQKRFQLPLREILVQLQEVGLDSLPGGGAEIFSERIRRRLFPGKIGGKRWLDIHAMAHKLGIPSNATMLYGHLETCEERLRHMLMLRDVQERTGGFLSFIPLPFQPGTSGIKAAGSATSAVDDLKTIAISRLMLDNFPHIKAYWVMLTTAGAALALHFGADDLDGTVGGERIAHDAGATAPQRLAAGQLIKLIESAGKIAVERDVFYHPLKVHGQLVIGKIPYLNSVPFYHYFPRKPYRLLPVAPRHMGVLATQGQIEAGPFSLMDYLAQQDSLDLMDFCIASPKKVGSVLLFARRAWPALQGKDIGITDDTSTSVRLLQVLLEKKYHIQARLHRMPARGNSFKAYEAVLLIGDEALKNNKSGLSGFPFVFDLAREWHDWQGLPFVFAVWAHKKGLSKKAGRALVSALNKALTRAERELPSLGARHGLGIGLTPEEAHHYLAAFQYRLGTEEKEAIRRFQRLVHD